MQDNLNSSFLGKVYNLHLSRLNSLKREFRYNSNSWSHNYNKYFGQQFNQKQHNLKHMQCLINKHLLLKQYYKMCNQMLRDHYKSNNQSCKAHKSKLRTLRSILELDIIKYIALNKDMNHYYRLNKLVTNYKLNNQCHIMCKYYQKDQQKCQQDMQCHKSY